MARITVEDCIDKVEGPYDLVLIAKERAVQLNSGEQPNVDPENDKNTVIALKEIAENKVSVDELRESAINKLRKHVEQDKGEISKSGVPILPSKRARKIPEKIEIFKEELVQKKIFKSESLPENKEISLKELEDQEKIKEGSDELVDPKSSDNA